MPDLATELRRASIPLRGADDLAPLLDAIGDARYVLLGEASHGTHEFYSWRCALTKRLVKEKACSFIAVEGDWPDCYRVIFNNDRDGGISGMDQAIDHRAIGVVYNPAAERWGNYVPPSYPGAMMPLFSRIPAEHSMRFTSLPIKVSNRQRHGPAACRAGVAQHLTARGQPLLFSVVKVLNGDGQRHTHHQTDDTEADGHRHRPGRPSVQREKSCGSNDGNPYRCADALASLHYSA